MSFSRDLANVSDSNELYVMVYNANVGSPLKGGLESSNLAGLMVKGEVANFAAEGPKGSVLFTDKRVLISEQVGVISKRMAVHSLRRTDIRAFSIDPSDDVTVVIIGKIFGQAILLFDKDFDPMLLTQWLGETLLNSDK